MITIIKHEQLKVHKHDLNQNLVDISYGPDIIELPERSIIEWGEFTENFNGTELGKLTIIKMHTTNKNVITLLNNKIPICVIFNNMVLGFERGFIIPEHGSFQPENTYRIEAEAKNRNPSINTYKII